MHREFATFTVLLVLLLIGLGVLVALPEVRIRERVDEEVRVFRALQTVAAAQYRRRIEASPGSPRTFGFLADLPEARTEIGFEGTLETDAAAIGAYRVTVFLPDEDGRPLPWSARSRVHAPHAARSFLAVARPIPERSDYRVYVVNQIMLVREWRGEGPAPGSADPLAAPLERLVETDPETGKLSLPTFPDLWSVTLRNAQRRWMRKYLTAAGLPHPRALDPEKD